MELIILLLILGIFVFGWLRNLGKPPKHHSRRGHWDEKPDLYRPNATPAVKSIDWSKTQQPVIEKETVISGKCWVVDGDTITIDGLNIRLAGIDAPEMDHPDGKNAKWHLLKLTKGAVITAKFYGAQSYTREVATCYLPDGRDLSAEMVKAGMAINWPKFSGGKYRHLETPDARKHLWRADGRQKGRWPPPRAN